MIKFDQLREAVKACGVGNWVAVAEHMGGVMDAEKCRKQWVYANPAINLLKQGPWSEDEVYRSSCVLA